MILASRLLCALVRRVRASWYICQQKLQLLGRRRPCDFIPSLVIALIVQLGLSSVFLAALHRGCRHASNC